MKFTRIALVATSAALFGASYANACAVDGAGLSILSNDFPAINAVQSEARACGAETEENADVNNLFLDALSASPAAYNMVIGANSTFSSSNAAGLLASITDVPGVADLPAPMKIMQDGEVKAIAFMANASHLMVRQDILDDLGLAVPTSYEEVLDVADAMKAAGVMEYPLTGRFAAGWNLANEFVEIFQATGESMFADGANPNVNNDAGLATLNMMKELTSRMNPDFLTFDSNAVQAQFEAGEAAIANNWGSRAAKVAAGAEALGGSITHTSAPTMGGGSAPAGTLWWDGFMFAANQSADELASAVALAIDSADADMLGKGDNSGLSVWLIDGYSPTPAATGVFATANAGAKAYPMVPYMGTLHTAIGAEIVEFLQGAESAEQALADVEAAYIAAATEAGYL